MSSIFLKDIFNFPPYFFKALSVSNNFQGFSNSAYHFQTDLLPNRNLLTWGIVGSIWISTMATMANPERRAEVRLEAFSLARLRFSVFQWKMLSSMPWLPILRR